MSFLGESTSVKEGILRTREKALATLIKGYELKDLCKCDEIALFICIYNLCPILKKEPWLEKKQRKINCLDVLESRCFEKIPSTAYKQIKQVLLF